MLKEKQCQHVVLARMNRLGQNQIVMNISTSTNELILNADTEVVAAKEVLVLHCTGYVDATTFNDFQSAIMGLLEQQQNNLVLDMSGITYIHSTGYGLLLTAHRQAQSKGGNLVIAGFSSKVTNVFNLLGFDHIIPTFPTVAEALASFS